MLPTARIGYAPGLPSSLPPAERPLFINNTWRAPIGSNAPGAATIEVLDAATADVIATLPEATQADVDAAFDAARRAFPDWSALSGTARADVLRNIAAGIKKEYDVLSKLEAHMGKLVSECKWDVDDAITAFEYYAGLATKLDARQGTDVPLSDDDYKSVLPHACARALSLT